MREKRLVTFHMIRGIGVKYPRSKRGRLRDSGYRITRLSLGCNRRGSLLGCLKMKEIMILNGGDSDILNGGRISDLGNIRWFWLVSGFVVAVGFNMTINLTIIATTVLSTTASTISTMPSAMRWVWDKGGGIRRRGRGRGMTKNMWSGETKVWSLFVLFCYVFDICFGCMVVDDLVY